MAVSKPQASPQWYLSVFGVLRTSIKAAEIRLRAVVEAKAEAADVARAQKTTMLKHVRWHALTMRRLGVESPVGYTALTSLLENFLTS